LYREGVDKAADETCILTRRFAPRLLVVQVLRITRLEDLVKLRTLAKL